MGSGPAQAPHRLETKVTPQDAPGTLDAKIRCPEVVDPVPTQPAPQSVAALKGIGENDAIEKTKTIQVPAAHFNSTMTDSQAEAIVIGQLTGQTQCEIARKSGASQVTTSLRMRNIQVPDDFPETHEGVMNDVLLFLDVAMWKGVKRLAQEVMETIKPEGLPVATAVVIDKVSMLRGQPTSYAIVQHQSIDHRGMMDRIKQAKASSQVVDVKQVP